jgi:hypothetical protein
MEPIEIPFATLPFKLIMGPSCLLVVSTVLWWGIPKFMTFLRILSGREPRKPGTKNIHLALGFVIYAFVFAPALIAADIFIQMMTTPPAIVSNAGVTGGGGALSSRKTIAWDEVQRVDCDLRRADHSVTKLRIVATNKIIELAGGGDLSDIRDLIWSKVPRQAVQPCSAPFGSATGL